MKVVSPESQSVENGHILDVTTAIPVKLRQMLMAEGRDMKDLRAEYGRRIHFNVKLDRGEEVLVSWDDVDLFD